MGNFDMDAVLKFLLLKQLAKDSGRAPGIDDVNEAALGQQDVMTKAFARYSKYKGQLYTSPETIVTEYRDHVRAELGVRTGDIWSYRHYWKTMPFDRFRSVGRLGYLLTEAMDFAEEPGMNDKERLMVVRAMLAQGLKACHQFALDQGSWRAAWPLTMLRDPYRQTGFGGTEPELNLVAGLLKAEDDLRTRVHGGRPYKDGGEAEQESNSNTAGGQARGEKGSGKKNKGQGGRGSGGGDPPPAAPQA